MRTHYTHHNKLSCWIAYNKIDSMSLYENKHAYSYNMFQRCWVDLNGKFYRWINSDDLESLRECAKEAARYFDINIADINISNIF